MNDWNCDAVQNHLPEWASGALDDPRDRVAVDRHLEGCRSCRDTADLVLGMASLPRALVPDGLEQRIIGAVRADRASSDFQGSHSSHSSRSSVAGDGSGGAAGHATGRSTGRSAGRSRGLSMRSLALAASLVLAVGTPWVVRQMRAPGGLADPGGAGEQAELAQVAELLPSAGLGDDHTIAGALMLDDLTDDELMAILEELER